MTSRKKKGQKISRRKFIQNMAIGATTFTGAGILSGCKTEDPLQPATVNKYDKEADVIIIGYGLAGATTAISAHDAGAKVLILEKMPKGKEGGNSKVSGNIVFIPDKVKEAKAYFKGLAKGHLNDISENLVQVWAEEMTANKKWLENLGLEVFPMPHMAGMNPEYPNLPGSDSVNLCSIGGQLGNAALWNPVSEEVKKRKIEIIYSTSCTDLINNYDNEVIGVKAKRDGNEIRIKAEKGVVLTCGSFEFNETMKANYLKAPCFSTGTPGNTGDGIRMAQAVGADLWHMNNVMGPVSLGFLTDDLGKEFTDIPAIIWMFKKGHIFVDKYGKRFMNERSHSKHGHGWDAINYYDGDQCEYPRIPWWLVFDEKVRMSGPLVSSRMGKLELKITWFSWHTGYSWSADNSAEIKKGWILKGKTIKELARAMNVDSGVLSKTLINYNKYAKEGEDKEYNRSSADMRALKGPFYALKAWPVMVNTQGGPKRNHKAQVMHVNGNPIPRLYSAGECGSVYAWLYQGGGNLGECLAFGRIAGRNVANEKSWR